MPRSEDIRDKVLEVASARLAALVGAREPTSEPESLPLVVEPPAHAFGAIARVAVIFGLVVGGLVWFNRPQPVTPVDVQAQGVDVSAPAQASTDLPAALSSPGSQSMSDSVSAAATRQLVVDVEGHVRHPGLVTLPPDSRIADAISAAGGMTQRVALGMLNLAQKVTDGQLIVVASAQGQTGEVASGSGAGSASGAGGGLINLNTGSETDLDALPGVGPVMAGRIIAWRTENGGFHSVDDLQQVPGIGPKVFANLQPLVCI
jgi:competence protein ComEA